MVLRQRQQGFGYMASPLITVTALKNPLDAVFAVDNPNCVAEPDSGRIAFISLTMARESLRNLYPAPARLFLA